MLRQYRARAPWAQLVSGAHARGIGIVSVLLLIASPVLRRPGPSGPVI
jgi:hypothetical protein